MGASRGISTLRVGPGLPLGVSNVRSARSIRCRALSWAATLAWAFRTDARAGIQSELALWPRVWSYGSASELFKAPALAMTFPSMGLDTVVIATPPAFAAGVGPTWNASTD
jgi:hypothetical protein